MTLGRCVIFTESSFRYYKGSLWILSCVVSDFNAVANSDKIQVKISRYAVIQLIILMLYL